MKNAFIDANGVLTSFGYAESNNDDQLIKVADEFDKEPRQWKYAGNQWVAYVPPAPVPTSVTMRQARLALLAAGKLAAVNSAIAALPSPQKEAAQIEWDFAAVVERQSQIVQLLGVALGLDGAALDALFVQAAAL